jgi:hypothetical protein
MSRNRILATGALMWAAVALDAIGHAVNGDWVVPSGMVIVTAAWLVLRRPSRRLAEAS